MMSFCRKATAVFIFLALCSMGFAKDGLIEFEFSTPNFVYAVPNHVYLTGSFNDWKVKEQSWELSPSNGSFLGTFPIPDGTHEYKFFVTSTQGDDLWLVDPGHAYYAPDLHGGVNSLLVVQNGERITPEDGLEYFEYEALPETQFVNLAGDFNEWKQGTIDLLKFPDGLWRCWLKVERPITYRFVVDDMWHEDPMPGNLKVPSNFDGLNSLRPRFGVEEELDWLDSPEIKNLKKANTTDFQAMESSKDFSRRGEYGKALAMAKVSGELAKGTKEKVDTAKCKALCEEASIHRRFGLTKRAVPVWEKIRSTYPDSGDAKWATHELAKYYLYIENDPAQARVIFSELLDSAKSSRDTVSALFDISVCYWQEKRYEELIPVLNEAMQIADPPDPNNNDWTHLLTEILVYKGISEYRTGDSDEAYKSLSKVIEISPWPNAHNVQFAKNWLARIESDRANDQQKNN